MVGSKKLVLKKIILSILFALSFLGASRSFAAGEGPGRISVRQAMGTYGALLSEQDRKEFERELEGLVDWDYTIDAAVVRDLFVYLQSRVRLSEQAEQAGQAEEKEGPLGDLVLEEAAAQQSYPMSVEDAITIFSDEYGLTDAESKLLASELERQAPQGHIDSQVARSIAESIAYEDMPALAEDFEEIEEKSEGDKKEQASVGGAGTQRLTVYQAVEKYAHALNPAQHEPFEQQLIAVADEYGFVDVGVVRDVFDAFQRQAGETPRVAKVAVKAEQVGGQAQEGKPKKVGARDLFRTKKLKFGEDKPVAVSGAMFDQISAFLPAGYVMPLEWNIEFPRGKAIQEFARIKVKMLDISLDLAFKGSLDGRKVALKYSEYRELLGLGDRNRVVWDMQDSSRKRQISDNPEWPFAVDNMADDKSHTYSFDGTKRANRMSDVGPRELARNISTYINFEQEKDEK